MIDSTVIDVDALCKTYRSGLFGRKRFDALRGISFRVDRGQIFGLLGPNGAGKTTVIKVLLGIVRSSGGSADLLGRPAGDREGRRRVGYLPENLRIGRHHTAYTALSYYGQLSGLPSGMIRQARDALLEHVGLSDWSRTRIGKYSKGMLQRLGLAQALLHDPEVLILDEPTDGLDPVGRSTVRELLLELKRQGKTIFLNSHLLQEVELICDKVAILDHGQLRFVGSIDALTDRSSGDTVQFELAGDASAARRAMDGFAEASWESQPESLRVIVRTRQQSDVDRCIDRLREQQISILSVTRQRTTLEDAFLQMVGDDAAAGGEAQTESPSRDGADSDLP